MTPTDPVTPRGAPGPQTPTRRKPEPLVTNDRATVAVGSGIWVVLLVLALLRADDLEATGRGWWVWACVSGVTLGVIGLTWLQLRARRQRRPPA